MGQKLTSAALPDYVRFGPSTDMHSRRLMCLV